jgi:DNA polymerase-3 subunit chi
MLFDQVPHSDVLIHMGSQPLTEIVELANRFERVVEIVSTSELDLIAGRERFKHYRSLGLELTNYDQKGAA